MQLLHSVDQVVQIKHVHSQAPLYVSDNTQQRPGRLSVMVELVSCAVTDVDGIRSSFTIIRSISLGRRSALMPRLRRNNAAVFRAI